MPRLTTCHTSFVSKMKKSDSFLQPKRRQKHVCYNVLSDIGTRQTWVSYNRAQLWTFIVAGMKVVAEVKMLTSKSGTYRKTEIKWISAPSQIWNLQDFE